MRSLSCLRVHSRLVLWFAFVFGSLFAQGQNDPDARLPLPVATATYRELFPSLQNEYLFREVTFASEDSVAIAACALPPEESCQFEVLSLSGSKLSISARTNDFNIYSQVHRSGQGEILVSGVMPKDIGRLFSATLASATPLNFDRSRISTSGATVGKYPGDGQWTISQLRPEPHTIRTGTDLLLSVSDVAFLIKSGKVYVVESLDGKKRWDLKGHKEGKLIGNDRIYTNGGVIELNGKLIARLPKVGGWGHTNSDDKGERILFDRFLRREHFAEKINPLPNDNAPANMEVIRVMAVDSGRTCLVLEQPHRDDEGHGHHADISPSGKRVVVATPSSLNIYSLSEDCGP